MYFYHIYLEFFNVGTLGISQRIHVTVFAAVVSINLNLLVHTRPILNKTFSGFQLIIICNENNF